MVNNTGIALLSLNGVSKSYPAVVANDRINLEVQSGSIHAILGENGAGKSTLVKLVYGLISPDSGYISWQGQRVALRNSSAARKLGIGMVFQHFSLFETLSVVENISLTMAGSRSSLVKRIREIGDRYQLTVNPEASVHSLSVGERQRVEIIRCLLQDLKLLILDEPTSVLPPQQIQSLFDALRKLRDSGVAILFISHKLEEITQLCDTATILRDGRVADTVDPKHTSPKDLATLMVGRSVPTVSARAQQQKTNKPLLQVNALSSASEDPFSTNLTDINLEVYGGEIAGIAGVSGNGQQELSRLISGEQIDTRLGPDTIRLIDENVTDQNAAARRGHGFSFVPEERLGRGAVPPMALSKNTLLTAYTKNLLQAGFVRQKNVKQYTKQCIEEFDVRCGGSDATASSLSGGNLQKFIVGRELMLKPRVLFISQPTWGVDIGAATAIRQRLIDLRDQGIAVLIISEDLEELFEITDRLYVMNRGKLSPPLITNEVTPNDVGEYMIGTESSTLQSTQPAHAS